MGTEFNFTQVPQQWWTGITLYRIGEIDPSTETYELDFNYWVQLFDENDKTDFQNSTLFEVDFVNSAEYELDESKGIIQKIITTIRW